MHQEEGVALSHSSSWGVEPRMEELPSSSSSFRSLVSKGNAAYAMSDASLPPPPTSGSAGCSEPPPSGDDASEPSCPWRGDPGGLSRGHLHRRAHRVCASGSIGPAGATDGALSCSAPVTSLQGTQIKSPHHQQGEEGLEDGNHRLRPPAAPDINLGQGSGVCPNLLLLLLHPSDPLTGQMLPLPRHQIPCPALLQGGQRNGTEKPPLKQKNNPALVHPSFWPLISPLPRRQRGNPPQESRDSPISLLLKGKNSPGRPSAARTSPRPPVPGWSGCQRGARALPRAAPRTFPARPRS